jgi:hypothetical protein
MRRMLSLFAVLILSVPVAALEVKADQLKGKPEFSSGDALGYFVWIDGNTWKLRWTTFGAEHRFTGRITIDAGEFRKFKRIDRDTERKVLAPGRAPRVVRGPRGRVVGTTGGRPAVVASKEEDVILQETERLIRFNTKTNDDADGVDFEISPEVTSVRFMLQIEGKPVAQEVELGKSNLKPNEMPLVIRVK